MWEGMKSGKLFQEVDCYDGIAVVINMWTIMELVLGWVLELIVV